MKKILFSALLLCSASIYAQNDTLGIWEGKLNVGAVSLRIVFHIDKIETGIYKATMDSPDQGAKGIPCSNVTLNGNGILIELKAAHGFYKGSFENNNSLKGTWTQAGKQFPLDLKHVTKITEQPLAVRYQTPKPPFNYNIDSVEYDNADKTVHFGATLTYPKTKGPFAVAVMITGSGLQDRDETVMNHRPFAVIADYLTKNGIAVLRVDDRNIGKSKGDVNNATSADFANDVIASIQYLLTRNEIDKNKIGVIGHSEGGFIAPMIYTKWPQLSFIISLAGTGVSGADILVRQETDPLKDKVSNEAFESFYSLTKQTLQMLHDNANANDSVILNNAKKIFADWKAGLSDTVSVQLNVKMVTPELYVNNQLKPELNAWLKYFIVTEPDQFWSKVKCPVLVLNGEKDIQVYAEQNTKAIEASLKKAGNKNVTIKVFPGQNHLFQHCTKCTVAEYAELGETFSVDALETMNNWLQQNVVKK
ncbi:MAG: prolyl oligopeptidase family serine peptidase [Bacteroidota bacterium]|nr:prolyl oligopeptidase family serine peptidase [Bacteroidota bacterium]